VARLVLKLGGSIVTRKDSAYTARLDVLAAYARLLRRLVGEGHEVLVVLGGGSYGHTAVLEALRRGEGPSSLLSIASRAMDRLASIASEVFEAEGLHPVVYPPRSLCDPSGLQPRCDWRRVEEAMQLGALPLTHGDVYARGGSALVVSGDELAAEAACKLRASRLVYATGVDGVYREGALVERVEGVEALRALLGAAGSSHAPDVTGGMRRKLEAILVNACRGLRVYIVNGMRLDVVGEALAGGEPRGTILYL